jgi:transposase
VRNRYLKHAHLSDREFRQVLKMYCADVGVLTASKLTGLNKNTTHRLYGLLRARVVEMAKGEAAPFTGSVEVDESYFGPRRVRGRRGRGSGRKVVVTIPLTPIAHPSPWSSIYSLHWHEYKRLRDF